MAPPDYQGAFGIRAWAANLFRFLMFCSCCVREAQLCFFSSVCQFVTLLSLSLDTQLPSVRSYLNHFHPPALLEACFRFQYSYTYQFSVSCLWKSISVVDGWEQNLHWDEHHYQCISVNDVPPHLWLLLERESLSESLLLRFVRFFSSCGKGF